MVDQLVSSRYERYGLTVRVRLSQLEEQAFAQIRAPTPRAPDPDARQHELPFLDRVERERLAVVGSALLGELGHLGVDAVDDLLHRAVEIALSLMLPTNPRPSAASRGVNSRRASARQMVAQIPRLGRYGLVVLLLLVLLATAAASNPSSRISSHRSRRASAPRPAARLCLASRLLSSSSSGSDQFEKGVIEELPASSVAGGRGAACTTSPWPVQPWIDLQLLLSWCSGSVPSS